MGQREDKLEFQTTFKCLKRRGVPTRSSIGTNKRESSGEQQTMGTASAMVPLGVKGIRRKLRVKLWGKIYLGSDRCRNTELRRSESSIKTCPKDLTGMCKSSFSLSCQGS